MGFQCTYKGFLGEYKFDFKTDKFRGQLVNIPDHIFFSGISPEETKKAMKEAVDAYLEIRVTARKDLLRNPQGMEGREHEHRKPGL